MIDDWMEVDEQELVYPITRDSSKRREEKKEEKEEKAFSSSPIVHKTAGSRRESHFFSSRLSDFDLLLFVPGQFFFSKIVDRPFLFVYSCFFGGFVPSFDRLLLCLAVLIRLRGGIVLPAVPLRVGKLD